MYQRASDLVNKGPYESKKAQRVVFILTLSSSIGIYITGLAVSEITKHFKVVREALMRN